MTVKTQDGTWFSKLNSAVKAPPPILGIRAKDSRAQGLDSEFAPLILSFAFDVGKGAAVLLLAKWLSDLLMGAKAETQLIIANKVVINDSQAIAKAIEEALSQSRT